MKKIASISMLFAIMSTVLAQPEEGICNDSNSNPPKFTSFVQQEGTNNFVVGYSGDTPDGYTATSITFNLNFDDKEFIATNAIENGNFIFDDTDREGILVLTPDEAMDLLNNMKENGNNPSKYTVTFTYITDSGITCTRTVDAEGFKDYVPVFPKPDFDITLICDEEGKTALVEFTSDPLALYPSDSQIILSDNEGIVDIFAIDVGSITLSNPGDYFLGIDINHDGMIDESEPVSDVISFEEEIVPSIDSFNLSVLNNTITPEYDVSYDGENELTATITINSDVLDDPIVIDITSDTFGDNIDAITNLEPGSYSATLSVDHGGCDTIEAMSNEVTIPRKVSKYPDPTFDVTLICDDEGEAALVEFTFGDIEDPSGPYPSDAQIVLLDDEGVVDIFAIDIASITITDPGNYSIGIDIDGDNMLEEGDPVVEAVSFEAEIVPKIDSFNLSVVNNTIIPEYSVSYDGENELSAMITIDSEVLDEPIIIEISNDTFGDNLDAIANLEPGVYSAMISVDYGGCNTVEAMAADVTIPAPVDDPPVNEPPVNEPPKLVYTSLENNLFESIMLSIKESVLSIF